MMDGVKKNNISPALLAVFCVLLYPPYLRFLSITHTKIIVLAIVAIMLCINRRIVSDYIKREYKSIMAVGLMVILSVLVPVFHNTDDYSYVPKAASFFIQIAYYLFMSMLIRKKHGTSNTFRYFLLYFALVHAVHVVGTILLVLIPQLKALWFSVFSQIPNMEERLESYGYTFRFGWQGYAGFRLTMHCAISIAFLTSLYIDKEKRFVTGRQFALAFLLNLIGCMFYGRSGLIASIIITAPYFIFKALARPKYLAIIIVSILSVFFCLNAIKNVPIFHDWYIWMSTPIKNYIATGDMQNSSFSELERMNSIQISDKTLFLGDGKFMDNGHYYRRTDAGFIRSILFWGLAIAVPVYAFTIIKLKKAFGPNALLFVQILIIFIIFEYKGDVYYEFLPLASIGCFLSKYIGRNNK